MHVLFTTPPAPGHVYPTLPLVEELVDRDHRVTYISGPSLTSELHLTGASVVDPVTVMERALSSSAT